MPRCRVARIANLWPADVDENSLASMKMNDADLKDYIGMASLSHKHVVHTVQSLGGGGAARATEVCSRVERAPIIPGDADPNRMFPALCVRVYLPNQCPSCTAEPKSRKKPWERTQCRRCWNRWTWSRGSKCRIERAIMYSLRAVVRPRVKAVWHPLPTHRPLKPESLRYLDRLGCVVHVRANERESESFWVSIVLFRVCK